jgi:hypothetical protein
VQATEAELDVRGLRWLQMLILSICINDIHRSGLIKESWNHMVFIWEIIPFYGRTIQVSEIL